MVVRPGGKVCRYFPWVVQMSKTKVLAAVLSITVAVLILLLAYSAASSHPEFAFLIGLVTIPTYAALFFSTHSSGTGAVDLDTRSALSRLDPRQVYRLCTSAIINDGRKIVVLEVLHFARPSSYCAVVVPDDMDLSEYMKLENGHLVEATAQEVRFKEAGVGAV